MKWWEQCHLLINCPWTFGWSSLNYNWFDQSLSLNSIARNVPNKFWKGIDVFYNHLKVFGCKVLVHIPKNERLKLDSKLKECIFLWYGNVKFGYQLWNHIKRKIVRNKDVFFEDQNIEDIQRHKKFNGDIIVSPIWEIYFTYLSIHKEFVTLTKWENVRILWYTCHNHWDISLDKWILYSDNIY